VHYFGISGGIDHRLADMALQATLKPMSTRSHTIGNLAADILSKHFASFSEHEKDILADTDPEHLHKTRVALRRMRTALRVFAPALRIPKSARDKRIGLIVRRLGAVRDLDVFKMQIEACRQVSISLIQQMKIDDVTHFIQAERDREFKELKETLEAKRYQEFVNEFSTWLKTPQWQAPFSKYPLVKLLPNLILPWLNELFLHPGLFIGIDGRTKRPKKEVDLNFFETNEANIHSLRRHIKRVRYVLEFFGKFYSSGLGVYVKQLEEAQEWLGVLHDHLAVEKLLTSKFDPLWKNSATELARSFEEEKKRMWKQWQVLQKEYLSVEFQKNWSFGIFDPIRKPH
jgi:CHAD domain-containing protein